MVTTNIDEAQRLKQRKAALVRMNASLGSAPIVNIQLTDVNGRVFSAGLVDFQKNTGAAAPSPYQVLGASTVTDLQALLIDEINSITAEIAGLSC